MEHTKARPGKFLSVLAIASVVFSAILLLQQLYLLFDPATKLESFTMVTGAVRAGNPVVLGDLPGWLGIILVIPLFAGVFIAGLGLRRVLRRPEEKTLSGSSGFSSAPAYFLTAFIVELLLSSVAAVIILLTVDVSNFEEKSVAGSGLGVFPIASALYLVTALALRFLPRNQLNFSKAQVI